MGWFESNESIPNEFVAMTDGWFTDATGGVVSAVILGIVPIIHHQHMAMAAAKGWQ